ncbi:hypothetical protein DPSP01_010020 [Paraphaeosphaeria sporulosa]
MARPIVLSARAIQNMPEESFPSTTPGGNVTWRTLLSSPSTPSTALTTGLARCAAQGGQLKCHRHSHPEIYYIVSGRGVVSIKGVERAVGKGDVVFIPGDAVHGVRNDDEGEELVWLYVFAADGFGEVVYQFCGEGAGKARL